MKLRLALVAEQWIMIKLIFLIEKFIKDLFVWCYTALLGEGQLYRLKLGAALYTERTDGGGEDGDDEINDGFPVYFHCILLFFIIFA